MPDITALVVATMRHPVLVLDEDLSVTLANRAFCESFEVARDDTLGRKIYELGNGQWDIPELRRLLEKVLSDRKEIEDYRVEHEFEQIGRRVMMLNARLMHDADAGARILLAIEDITERERARWELEAEREYAEKTVDASRDALLILGWDLRVKSANETFYKKFQVDPNETEGRLVYELGDGQWDIPLLRELLENVLRENAAFDDFEVEHEFEDLGHRIMLLNARKIDHKEWILLAIEDLTERRRSERDLRASEARLSAILEHIPIGVGVLDKEGRWKLLNPVMRQYMGEYLPSRDPQQGSHWRTVDDEGRPLDASQYPAARALRGERVPPEVDFLTDVTGEPRWMRVGAAPLPGDAGTIEEAVAVAQDVTEQRRTLEALRASEARLRRILETEAVGVLFFDESGALTDANEVFLRMTGYSRDEIESRALNWRKLTPPEWIEESEKEMARLAETGRIGPYEKEYILKDGSRSWMLLAGQRLDESTFVEFCVDISARKQAEEEREFLVHELSHRVKNTLAVVQALAFLTNGQRRSVDDFRTAFLGRLQALAKAHDVLIDAQWQSADLKALAEQATEIYRVSDPDVVEIDGEPVTITAKQGLGLSLVLHELGTNAVKYGALTRPEGRLRVSWEIDPAEDGRWVRLVWRERCGPAVEPPRTSGFGTKLIEQACAYELGGEAELDYAPEGLACRIAFPLKRGS